MKTQGEKGRGPFVRRDELRSQPIATTRVSAAAHDEFAVALVLNESGSQKNVFDVVQITGPLTDPTTDDEHQRAYYSQMQFRVGAIADDDVSTVCVLQSPAENNRGAPAVFTGITVARLTGQMGHARATTRIGQVALEAALSGPFEILHDPGPANEQRLAYVRFGGSQGDSGGGSTSFGDCACGGCLDAGTVSACTAIGDAPLSFAFALTGLLASAFGSTVILTHSSGCTWESDLFEDVDIGDGAHDYTFRLVFSGKSIEEAELTLEDET